MKNHYYIRARVIDPKNGKKSKWSKITKSTHINIWGAEFSLDWLYKNKVSNIWFETIKFVKRNRWVKVFYNTQR